MQIRIKRAYEKPGKQDGSRILVDRIWPRGVSKDEIELDHWLKAVAPSDSLRKWFDHDVEKWSEFDSRYRKELKEGSDDLQKLRDCVADGRVTLIYGAKDEAHNQAVVLRDFLRED